MPAIQVIVILFHHIGSKGGNDNSKWVTKHNMDGDNSCLLSLVEVVHVQPYPLVLLL